MLSLNFQFSLNAHKHFVVGREIEKKCLTTIIRGNRKKVYAKSLEGKLFWEGFRLTTSSNNQNIICYFNAKLHFSDK